MSSVYTSWYECESRIHEELLYLEDNVSHCILHLISFMKKPKLGPDLNALKILTIDWISRINQEDFDIIH